MKKNNKSKLALVIKRSVFLSRFDGLNLKAHIMVFTQNPISRRRVYDPSSSSARSISDSVNFYIPEMGDKRKKTFMFIRLVSAAGTGFFYVKRKSSKKLLEKLEFRKYDPRVNRHVLFTEQKMK
ncbi:hypothetical protein V5N11_023817 [Cardamine amara subsp. amara]|uniref:50S ribosomal protein L33, chloroplastic n=1 Tax=Cardamine amara subsp. amara TaxID=228776 RepID=A0ABD1BCG9_CARAN